MRYRLQKQGAQDKAKLNQIRLRKQTFTCKGVLDMDCPVYVIVRFVN